MIHFFLTDVTFWLSELLYKQKPVQRNKSINHKIKQDYELCCFNGDNR